MIGCDCSTCQSTDARDRRLRPSIFVQLDDGTVGAGGRGAGPARAGARATTFGASTRLSSPTATPTTSSASTMSGASTSCRSARCRATADARTIADIRQTFAYAFDPATQKGGGLPQLVTFTIHGSFCVGRQEIVPVPLYHGARPILGLRFGAFAYLTDCNRIPDGSWDLLAGLDVLVIDALARPAAPDAFHARRGDRRQPSHRRAPDLLHAHVPRPAARRDVGAAARRAWSWPMMDW